VEPPRLYLITPPEGDPLAAVAAALSALPAGVAAVQLRQPLPPRALLDRALLLREICCRHGARLFLNDRADVAFAADADVHLPGRGLSAAEACRLGLEAAQSVHTAEEAARSTAAAFVVFAPVFATPGKTARGLQALRETCSASRVPVLALGGVDERNARACIEAGAFGVACIRSVLGAPDPASAARALWRAISP
jgi:thiamine-phosphate pyrophosphorylase